MKLNTKSTGSIPGKHSNSMNNSHYHSVASNSKSSIGDLNNQDLSGHVVFDYQQSKSLSEFMEKSDKIQVLRNFGLLKHRPTRNAILGERTPRIESTNRIDYHPPITNEPLVKSRWIEPQIDHGLLSKFDSQVDIYKRYNQQLHDLNEAMNRSNSYNHSLDSQLNNKVDSKIVSSLDSKTNSKVDSKVDNKIVSKVDNKTDKYINKSTNQLNNQSNKSINQLDNNWDNFRVSTLKSITEAHPNIQLSILPDLREKRAHMYVSKQLARKYSTKQLDKIVDNAKVFRPPGPSGVNTFDEFKHTKNNQLTNQSTNKIDNKIDSNVDSKISNKPLDESTIRYELQLLMDELHKTDVQIDRQKLKIGLNTKTKHYEIPRKKSAL